MKNLLILLIRLYQKFLSLDQGLLGKIQGSQGTICRFQPTCSQYTIQALEKYPLIKALVLSFKRIIRCHPLNAGGYDPVV